MSQTPTLDNFQITHNRDGSYTTVGPGPWWQFDESLKNHELFEHEDGALLFVKSIKHNVQWCDFSKEEKESIAWQWPRMAGVFTMMNYTRVTFEKEKSDGTRTTTK